MTDKDLQNKGRELQREIAAILLRNWDPLGVAGEIDNADEYAGYVGGVYRLLASGATSKEIAAHLAKVEAESLGYQDTDPKMLIPLAEKLRRKYAAIEEKYESGR